MLTHSAPRPFLPFHYFLVQDFAPVYRASLFHVLSRADLESLRCLMTLLLLPADTLAIDPSFPPYTGAVRRVFSMPELRKGPLRDRPVRPAWEALLKVPLLVLLASKSLPIWLS